MVMKKLLIVSKNNIYKENSPRDEWLYKTLGPPDLTSKFRVGAVALYAFQDCGIRLSDRRSTAHDRNHWTHINSCSSFKKAPETIFDDRKPWLHRRGILM